MKNNMNGAGVTVRKRGKDYTMSKETQVLEVIRNTHGKQTDGMSVDQFRALCDAVVFYNAKACDVATTARLVCEEMFP